MHSDVIVPTGPPHGPAKDVHRVYPSFVWLYPHVRVIHVSMGEICARPPSLGNVHTTWAGLGLQVLHSHGSHMVIYYHDVYVPHAYVFLLWAFI